MSTINPRNRPLAQVSRAATQPARITQAARPTTQDPALNAWIGAMHEWRHVREGGGNPFEKVLTGRDLVEMGLATSTQITNPATRPAPAAPGVVISTPNGQAVLGWELFTETIRNSRLIRDLGRRIDDPARFDELHARTKAALLEELAPIDGKIRGEIRRVEEIATSAKEALAQEVTTIRASVARASAGVRQVRAASANENRATAGIVTQVTAGLADMGGVAGTATVEDIMLAVADRWDGLRAQRTIKVATNGAMAGVGLASTTDAAGNATSAVIVQGSKFAVVLDSDVIADPLNPPVSRIPFGIDGTGIYMTGAVRISGGLIVSGTLDYANLGGTKPPSNADNTGSAINATTTITGGGIVMSGGGVIRAGKTAYGSGTGFWLGSDAGTPKFDIGSATSYLRWSGSALSVSGTMTGGSDIEITGGAKISGTKTSVSFGGAGAAIVANDSFESNRGVIAVANSNAQALVGYQTNAAGIGVYAENTAGGTALRSVGKMTITDSTMVANLNANYLGGYTLGDIQSYVAANYSPLTVPIANIQANVARSAAYSADGGASYTPILLKFS